MLTIRFRAGGGYLSLHMDGHATGSPGGLCRGQRPGLHPGRLAGPARGRGRQPPGGGDGRGALPGHDRGPDGLRGGGRGAGDAGRGAPGQGADPGENNRRFPRVDVVA